MRKNKFFTFLMVLITSFVSGCVTTDGHNQEIVSFEELSEINTYDNILKHHTNFYYKNTWVEVENDVKYTEETLFMKGENKINYHTKRTNLTTNEEILTASRIGNNWYYQPSNESHMCMLELGELSLLDDYIFIFPQIVLGNVIGKGYIENNQIVYHSSHIKEGFEDIPAKRSDFTYYFNKETKFIEKINEVKYNNEHKVISTYATEFNYEVDAEQIFPITSYDVVQKSEKCIDIEIIVNYGTEEQKSYSFFALPDMQIFLAIDHSTYGLYSDYEFTQLVSTLDKYDGQKNLTLYAKI